MEWWQIALIVVFATAATVVAGAVLVWRLATGRTKRLARRIGALSWRAKWELATGLFADRRIPAPIRAIVPLLVLYLALPLDLIPDFIPVIGQLDDVLVIVIGIALLVRFVPPRVLDEHIAALEPAVEGRVEKRLPDRVSRDR